VAKGVKRKSTAERRTLILWALLARENAAGFQNELKPEPAKDDRVSLETDGLIKSEKRKNNRIWIEVTERGWDWAGSNLGAALPTQSSAGSQILQAWLIKLKRYMEIENCALAEILNPRDASKMKGDAVPTMVNQAAVRKRVRDAYLTISGGRLNTRVLLRELRAKLPDIDRSTIDGALVQMQSDQEASLYQLDNRSEITVADRSAALYFGNEPRHILWIER
jgi:hypothetical protein